MEKIICQTCGQNKDIDCFSIRSDTLKPRKQCKDCYNSVRRPTRNAHRQEHREEENIKAKIWREKNPDLIKANSARYRQKYGEKIKNWLRQYRKEHPEKTKETAKKSYLSHREARIERAKEYNETQKSKPGFLEKMRQKSKESYKRWIEKNPLANRQRNHRRRVSIKGDFSAQEWIALCEKHNNRCLCCGEKKPLEIDHILPVSKGGANTIDNLQPLCVSCNRSKGTKHIDYR